MKKLYLICLVILSGCGGTQYVNYTSFPSYLENDRFLMMEVKETSSATSYELYQLAKQRLDKGEHITYYQEVEYDLINKGIGKQELQKIGPSDSINSLVLEALEMDHILIVSINSLTASGGTLGSYTTNELDGYNSHFNQDEQTRKSSLTFELISKNQSRRKYLVTTTINPLSFSRKDGGENRVNFSSKETVLLKAFKKGIKKLRDGRVSSN